MRRVAAAVALEVRYGSILCTRPHYSLPEDKTKKNISHMEIRLNAKQQSRWDLSLK
jgi:putative aminopeptidase FrvX